MKAGRIAFAAMIVFVLVTVPLAAYTVGYFALGTPLYSTPYSNSYFTSVPHDLLTIERMYPQQWQMAAFKPAGRLEAWCRGIDVEVTWSDGWVDVIHVHGTSEAVVDQILVEVGD